MELKPVPATRLIATVSATLGFIFGLVWAVHYGKYVALQRPVSLTDLLVIVLAWFIVARAFRSRPTAYWDVGLGLAAIATWYLTTLS